MGSYKSKHERQNDILLAAVGNLQKEKPVKEFTTAKMAKWIGYSVSTRLRNMLNDLVAQGWLEKEEKIHRNIKLKNGNKAVIVKHVYRLTQEAIGWISLL